MHSFRAKKIAGFQLFIIGLIYSAAAIFGFIEAEFFNTYLDHVLHLNVAIFVPIMVNLSALMGLIMNLVIGIFSDNTRSRFGRRRPYLIIGGLIAGSSMVLFAFSPNFAIAAILDVVIIGIASNSYYNAQRAFIPDLVQKTYRGRANGIAWIFYMFGMVFSLVLFLLLDVLFSYEGPGEETIITQTGYIFALGCGGIFTVIVSIIGFIAIKEKKGLELPPKRPFLKDFKNIFNLKELKENKEFYKLVIAFTVFKSGIQVVQPYLFIYIFELGFETTELFLIIGLGIPILLAIIYLLGYLADKYGRKKFILPTILMSCIGFFLMPVLAQFEIILPLYIFTFTLILMNIFGILVPLNAFSQDLLPEDKRGKFLGILNIIETISQNIGVTVGGVVIYLIGGTVWVFAFAPVFFIASIPLFLMVKETLIPVKKLAPLEIEQSMDKKEESESED